MISRYKILYCANGYDLEMEMMKLIEEGWQPFGAPQIAGEVFPYELMQAVVKYCCDKHRYVVDGPLQSHKPLNFRCDVCGAKYNYTYTIDGLVNKR